MSRNLRTRLEGLERQRGPSQVIIWCEDESEMGHQIILAMIGAGTLDPAERAACVHWTRATANPGEHERCLAELN